MPIITAAHSNTLLRPRHLHDITAAHPALCCALQVSLPIAKVDATHPYEQRIATLLHTPDICMTALLIVCTLPFVPVSFR